MALRVDEADTAVVEQTCLDRRLDRPGPGALTLMLRNRQVVLDAFVGERDRLGAECCGARGARLVALPLTRAGGSERDGRELGGETEARVRDAQCQTRRRLPDERCRRMRRAQLLREEARCRVCPLRLRAAGELSQEEQGDERGNENGHEHAAAPGHSRGHGESPQFAVTRQARLSLRARTVAPLTRASATVPREVNKTTGFSRKFPLSGEPPWRTDWRRASRGFRGSPST